MNYLITLTPLEPFLFGGDTTFGQHANKEEGSYIVKSTHFPQQSAILGMLRKEMMTQAEYLTRKRRGEWVDKHLKPKAEALVGREKFDMELLNKQEFGDIKNISPIFLLQENRRYIKKVDIESYPYEDGKLQNNYNSKIDIYDNYICLDKAKNLKAKNIWESVEQIGNKKIEKEEEKENALFKKTSYRLVNNFKFAFYLQSDYELEDSIVALGADRSSFKMEVTESNDSLEYESKEYITLLSDAYITEPVECDFAITSEISYRGLIGQKSSMTKNNDPKKNRQNNPFQKSKRIFLYERGSIFINPSEALINNLNNPNLQQIGYNIFSTGATK